MLKGKNLVKVRKNGTISLLPTREEAKKFYLKVHKNYQKQIEEQTKESNLTPISLDQEQEIQKKEKEKLLLPELKKIS